MADEQTINLKIRIGAEGVQSLELVDGKVQQLDKSVKAASPSVEALGGHLQEMLLAAGAVATIGGAASAYIAFKDAMANTASVAGATRQELQLLEQAARQQAAVSVFSAKQSADAQYHLASAGMGVNQIIAAQAGVMNLAAATQSNLAQTSAIVAATLSQFKLEAADAGHVADVFALAIGGSQATMDKLGISMRYVGPVAAALGLSLEQTTALLMALYNSGFEASQAGTTLRSAISTLLDPTEQQAKALAALGVQTKDASGQLKPLAEIIEELKQKGAGAAEIFKIFGQEAGPGMIALVSGGKAAIDELQGKLSGSGKAAEMAKQQVDTLGGDLKMLASASEEAAIAFFEELDPALRKTVQAATWLIGHSEILTRALGTAGAAVAIFKAEGLIATAKIGDLATGVGKLWALVLAHPFTAAAVAIGAVATGLAVWMAATDSAEEKQAKLAKAVQDTGQKHSEAAAKLDQARSALGSFETQIASATGSHRLEWEAVQKLNGVFPDLVRSYNNAEISLDRLVAMVKAHVAVLQEEETATRKANVTAAQARLDSFVSAYETALARVGEVARRYQQQIANYLAGAPIDVRGISEGSQGAAVAVGTLEAASKKALETIRELSKMGTQFPELADKIEGMKTRVVQDLEAMAARFTALSGAPANALAQIKLLLEGVSDASKKAGGDAAYSGDKTVQAMQAGAAEALKVADQVLKKQHDTTEARLDLLRRELAFAQAGSNEEAKLKLAVLELEREINKKREEEAKRSAERRAQEEKRANDEIIKSYKAVQDQRAKDEKIALDAAEKWEQKRGKLGEEYTLKVVKLTDGELAYKIAKLEEWWEVYYQYHEKTLDTERTRAADVAALQDEYAKKNRSALGKVVADLADADKHIGDLTTHTLKNIQGMLANDLAGGIKKVFGDIEERYGAVGARLIDITSQVVSQILVIWASANIARLFTGQPYLPLVGGILGGGNGLGGMASTAKGAYDAYSWFSGGGSWATSSLNPSLWGTPAGLGSSLVNWSAGEGAIEALGLSGMGYAASGIGGALSGWQLAQLLYGQGMGAQLGGALGGAAGGIGGAMLGTMILPGIGTIAGGLLGGLLGGAGGGGLGSLFDDEEDTPDWEKPGYTLAHWERLKVVLAGVDEQAQKGKISLEDLGGSLGEMAPLAAGAGEYLGGYGYIMGGILDTLTGLTPGTQEYADVLNTQLNPAWIISKGLADDLASGMDRLTAHKRALASTVDSLLAGGDLEAGQQQQLIDLLMQQSGNVEDLTAKYARYNEIRDLLTHANQLGAEKTAELVAEGQALYKELGLQDSAMGNLNKTLTSLNTSIDALAKALEALPSSKSIDIFYNEHGRSSYHDGGPVRAWPRLHGGGQAGLAAREVAAVLLQDEFVLKEQASRYYGLGLLNALNNTQVPRQALEAILAGPRYHDGGSVEGALATLMAGMPRWRDDALLTGPVPMPLIPAGPVQGVVPPGAQAGPVNVHVNVGPIEVRVDGDVVGEAGALERVREATSAAVTAGVMRALRDGSEAGQPLIHIRGLYGQDRGY
ncbi:MAG: phage tail tape measure protein [Desulfarculus sp.]|nr:phage tail tape measure protein [Desulfarculus sp.]